MKEKFEPSNPEPANDEAIAAALLITMALLIQAIGRSPAQIRRLINSASYDPSIQQYTGSSSAEIKRLINQLKGSLSRRSLGITEQLLSGEISLSQWQLLVTEETKNYSIVAAALAIGGLSVLQGLSRSQSSAFWNGINRVLRKQVDGLSRVSARIGNSLYTPDQVRWYGDYKSSSVVGAYNQARKIGLIVTGFNEARRWLDPAANHCPDCPAYETDWADISSVVPVGVACRCNGRCRCTVEYRFNPERILNQTLEQRIKRSIALENTIFQRLG